MVATNPMFKGGALDPDSCDKIASFIVLCDSFNLPLVFLADTPGFRRVESAAAVAGKIMNFGGAGACERSKIALVLRKSFGQAYLNMGAAARTRPLPGRGPKSASWTRPSR
ncbi:MAG: carboxyl transferase domain-containing protein [Alphaproteobacteria bacterium]